MDTKVSSDSRKVCRTCLRNCESKKGLISLFDYDQTCPQDRIKFSKMLSVISNQRISEDDCLPKKVCVMCISQIRAFYYFKIQVDESLKTLQLQRANKEHQQYRIPTIKQEPNTSMPLIMSPRTVGENNEEIEREENMLEEIISPVPHNSSNKSNKLEGDSHTDDEIIDYEPDMQNYDDDEDEQQEEGEEITADNSMKSSSQIDAPKGKSPDSGISSSTPNHASKTPICNVCKKEFVNLKAFFLHKRGSCSSTKCRYCVKKFNNFAQLKLHTRYKHPEKYNELKLNFQKATVQLERITKFNECSTCGVKLVSKLALLRHHADCDSKCIECGIKIPRKEFYFKHLESVHKLNADPSSLECPFCMNIFHSERILQEHIQRLHPDENQSEHQSFTDTMSEAGESTSNEPFLYECQICQARFKSSKSLNQHKSFKHKDGQENVNRIYKNHIVQKYSRDEFFEKFLVKKSDDFYRCLPCQKEIFKRSLMMHVKSKHAAVRSYRCELCPEAFFRADYRQRHFAIAHPYDFKCHECDVQFDRAYKYDVHMTQHGIKQTHFKPNEGCDRYDLSPNEIQYIEDSTNYDYSNDDALIKNDNNEVISAISNSTEIPMKKDEFCDKYLISVSEIMVNCLICQQEIQKASIISHLLWKHAVKKPLKCPFCNERVVKNNARLSHMSRCHPDAYKCNECNLQFVKHSLFVEHMWEFHFVKITTPASSGEEEDLQINDMYFVCNRNEDEIIIEPEHNYLQVNQNQEKMFGCQFCPKKFTSNKNLLIHKSHKHKNESFEPLNAVETIMDTSDNSMTFEEFQNNWVEVINDNDMKCLVCDQTIKTKSFIPHIKHKHCTSGAYLCAICPERFYRPEQRTQHMSSSHRGVFYCSTCNIQFYRNSRYAEHMSTVHAIDLDGTDNYEVDLNLIDLRFEPTIRRSPDEDSLPSIVHETDENDPMEEMMQQINTGEEFSRNEFMRRFIKGSGNDRHCLACNRTFFHTSIYHHIIHFHASILPFKCPFCDVRFERSYTRNKHLQLFHPKEYKCFECGLQFPKHAKYVDHMAIEHNVTVATQKSPFEEEDLASTDIRYVKNKSNEENVWQEIDENSIGNSTMYSEYNEKPSTSSTSFNNKTDNSHDLRSRIKNEPTESTALSVNTSKINDSTTEQHLYEEFKAKYLKKIDRISLKCLACDRVVIRTSVCAHLRLWHAASMMFNCELCDVGFRRSDYRQRHMITNHPNDHKCKQCNLQFHHSSLYKEHMYEAHKLIVNVRMLKKRDEVDVPLEKMMFSVHIPDNLRVHPADEHSKRGRRLSICMDGPVNPNAGGITYEDFQKRYMQELNESLYRCTVCDDTLSKFALKKHAKRFHATSKPYNCELCSQGFHRLDERLTHMHDSHNQALKCKECNIQFYMSFDYAEHMRNMHHISINISSNKSKTDIDVPLQRLRFVPKRIDDSSMTKPIAIKSEPSKKNSVETYNDISDDAQLTRDQFSKKFLRAFRGKDNELMLKCSACNKQFAAKHKFFHLLHNHVIVRPFGCELCDMRFYSNFKRLNHMKMRHQNDFNCQICSTQFEKAQIYVDHMLNEHKITVKAQESTNVDLKTQDLRYLKNPEGFRSDWRRLDYSSSSNTAGNTNTTADESENSNYASTETLFCDICNVDFSSARTYRQHIRDHGNGGDLLKIEIKQEPKINTEIQKEGTFQCEFCDKKVMTLFALKMHKKFKHGEGADSGVLKRKIEKQKFEVECQMCSFSAFRRDYVEHHIRQTHKLEFQCRLCTRVLSNFNFYTYHVFKYHGIREDPLKYFKCDDCNACFKFEENLQNHKQARHGENTPTRNYFCETCVVDFRSRSSLDSHLEMYSHRHLYDFLGNPDKEFKLEPVEKSALSHHEEENFSFDEPQEKRQKTSDNIEVSDDDKLDYLKYMHTTADGHFKCGICGKTKALRKYMLHHLKQHKEVPTYECNKCPERFVFKKKYEQHLEMHEHENVLEHPAITIDHDESQGSSSNSVKPVEEIFCKICNSSFKLTIMLNKHNSIWHANDNPDKHLSMNEQKAKKNESSKLNCPNCNLIFDDMKFLENHLKYFCVHRNQLNNTDELLNEQ
ncbi:hypothetical protein PVAND_011595 [Polypedilum vanderplanki]|uniref:Zinc finger protein n=1 Tax=Polypedilum vanderplanki TaxID=319348 RepID=A0A9J6CKW5_POLVA|nr:hypothetical protein PVAND_011595 [Polypedilum vanderplanki]